MRILLTTIGSSGDINPFIALGLELQRRGHEPVLLVNPYFKETIEGEGLVFEPLGEHVSAADFAREMPAVFGRVLGPLLIFRRLFVPFVTEAVETIRRAALKHRSEVLVGHQISLGLPWVAQELSLPWATCVLSPATLLSLHDPSRMPVGSDLQVMPMWYRRFAHWVQRMTMRVMIEGPLRRQRRARGLPPCREIFWGEMLSGDAVLGLWSPLLRGRAPDDPQRLTVCGFPWFDRQSQYAEHGQRLDPAVARFLDEGEPPVIFTLGSVLSHVSARIRRGRAGVPDPRHKGSPCHRACRNRSPRSTLPPGVMCVDYAPYGELFHRGAAIVHHGGVGTTAQALRSGRPTVIMPFAHDQFDNAARSQRLGVSVTLLSGQRSAKRLAKAIQATLGDSEMSRRAAEVGSAIAREDGVTRAAEALERIASSHATAERRSSAAMGTAAPAGAARDR